MSSARLVSLALAQMKQWRCYQTAIRKLRIILKVGIDNNVRGLNVMWD